MTPDPRPEPPKDDAPAPAPAAPDPDDELEGDDEDSEPVEFVDWFAGDRLLLRQIRLLIETIYRPHDIGTERGGVVSERANQRVSKLVQAACDRGIRILESDLAATDTDAVKPPAAAETLEIGNGNGD